MCYERTKIKICHKCFSTFLIPSVFFLPPSSIQTVTFHLHYQTCIFIYSLQTCTSRVSCIMGVYRWSKLLACDNTHAASYYIHYIHDTNKFRIMYSYNLDIRALHVFIFGSCGCNLPMRPTQFWIMYSYYATPSSVCHSDSLLNVS